MNAINDHDELEQLVQTYPAETNARATLMILRLLRSIAAILLLIAAALVAIAVEIGIT